MTQRLFTFIVLAAFSLTVASCEKNRIENKCCKDEYRIITTKSDLGLSARSR